MTRLHGRAASWQALAPHLRSLAIGLLALLWACGPAFGEAYLRSFRAAQRAHNAGRYEEAARLFEEAAHHATRIKDRDEAYFMRGYMFERMRRFAEAEEAYRELARLSPDGPRTARATLDAALLEADHGDAEAGWRQVRAAVLRYPNHGKARHALKLWAEHVADSQGEDALQAALEELREPLEGTTVEQVREYELALSLMRSGQLERAHAELLRSARAHPYPKGSLTDDALYRASEIAEQLGKPRQAIADLEELLGVRENAIGGSYERPRFPQAQMRIAQLYRERLGDRAAARRAYRRMYTQHASSILADDAMWHAAVLSLELAEPREACSVARALVVREPVSRYRRCVKELCPELAPVKGERPCPRYLAEQLPASVRATGP